MQHVSFDRHGFIFALKFLVLFFIVVGGLRVGGSVLLAEMLPPEPDYSSVAEDDPTLVERAVARLTEGARTVRANSPFASSVRTPAIADYVPETGLFLGIDLKNELVTLYQDGLAAREFPVTGVPTEGSASSIPTGLYAVEDLEREHFSDVAKLYLPDRITFGDRYAIHGPPRTVDGTEREEPETVGSIQLGADDAARLFDMLDQGVPLFVLAKHDADRYNTLAALAVDSGTMPAVSARSYAVADTETGEVYLSKNADKRYPIASITKLMTALVAHETYGVNEEISTYDGDRYVLGDLYYPLLLRSNNDVAHAIAEHGNTKAFLARMNTEARALGMYQTSFADSSGLSPRNISTAEDLALFGRYLYERKRFLLDISLVNRMTITSSSGTPWRMVNQNKMAADARFRGGKLGFTDEAGQTSLGLFTMPIGNEVRVVSVVILNSQDWKQDTRTLLSWFDENVVRVR